MPNFKSNEQQVPKFRDYVIFVPRKGSKPQKDRNRSCMKFSCFPGGDTQKSWAQTKFEAKPV